jgi:hypothetical protein
MPAFGASENQDRERLVTDLPLSRPFPRSVATGWRQYLGQSNAADSAEIDYTSEGGPDPGAPCVS